MIRNDAAYRKLAVVLGSRIVSRGRTLNVQGQPKQVYSETLLLIPPAKASALGISDAEVYIDKKTKEEFVALVVKQTKPRNKVRIPEPPVNPMMEWRPVLGQGGFCEGKGIMIVCPNHTVNCLCKELMAKVSVKITQTCPLSQLRYRQVVSQLDAYEENERISDAFSAIHKTGCPLPSWYHFLSFVPATEADSVLLVNHNGDDVQIQISATRAKNWQADDSSVHSTIPLNAQTPVQPATKILNINKNLLEKFKQEFDSREPK